MYIPAITFSQVTGTGIYVITAIVCIICTFYTCVGGLKAVIWSDVTQSFVMFGSILAVCIKGTFDVGGLPVVLQESGRLNAPDYEDAKRCMLFFTLLLIFLLSCCSYMGLVAYAVYHDCDPISTKLATAGD
ncbi:sodium-coupled monocarboxylate transporter 1 [Drosophila madeirensis]|uniref:Sodium-coupled monocarboxylate transporter 1 n=1 Tax=Drosophila madeirensis TaxID=30013 RepID=A0AAU9EWI3_DROMD